MNDLADARRFYEKVLGLEFESAEEGRHDFLKAGRSMLLLFNAEKTLKEKRLPPRGAKVTNTSLSRSEARNSARGGAPFGRKGTMWKRGQTGGEQARLLPRSLGNSVERVTPGNWPVGG